MTGKVSNPDPSQKYKLQSNEDFSNNQLDQLDLLIQDVTLKIRNNKYEWKGVKGMCEVCQRRIATVNLDLKYGSHRECQSCWDD